MSIFINSPEKESPKSGFRNTEWSINQNNIKRVLMRENFE